MCVCVNWLNLAFKKLCGDIHAHSNMSIQRYVRKTIGSTLHSKIPSPEDNHLFRQWVFTEYPVSGFGDVWENKVDSLPLEIRVDALTYLFLYLYGYMYANIDCFLPSPSPLPKKGGIKTHIFVTWFFKYLIGPISSSHYIQI